MYIIGIVFLVCVGASSIHRDGVFLSRNSRSSSGLVTDSYFLRNLSHTPSHFSLLHLAKVSVLSGYASRHHLSPGFHTSGKMSLLHLCTMLLLSGDIAINPGPGLNFGLCNIRSLKKNHTTSTDFVDSHKIGILSLTETWLTNSETQSLLSEVTPPGFDLLHNPRVGRTGGGVGLLVHKSFDPYRLSTPNFNTFECIVVQTKMANSSYLNFATVYRPPATSMPRFLEQFSEFLELLQSYSVPTVISGDFNIYAECSTYPSDQFHQLLKDRFLTQHIKFPTNLYDHTLDLVITPDDFDLVSDVKKSDCLTDHFAITCHINLATTISQVRTNISYRCYGKIDRDKMINDLNCSDLIKCPTSSAGALYDQYHDMLVRLLDLHAPLKSKKSCVSIPWFDQAIVEAKRVRRALELQWRKHKTSFTRSCFRKQVNVVSHMIAKAKRQFYTDSINDTKDDPKKLWKTLNTILHRKHESVLPEHSSAKSLADRFADFFIEKISKIQATFSSNETFQVNPSKAPVSFLDGFSVVSEDEVRKVINSSPTKSCSLDPWPTFLVKEYLDILIVPITKMVNLSLSEGIFPERFRNAIITPLHKKHGLPKDDLKSYRPVSGLGFISKVIERVVASQLNNHVVKNGLENKYQSAYRTGHSTETALLKLKNDIHLNMAENRPTAVILLDLSAAFDTINQTSLIDRLSSWFGVRKVALKWFTSYLSDRSQSVKVNTSVSNSTNLECGVPQGSVLGPILFSLYTAPLSTIISGYDCIKHLLYADDTQLYISLTPSNASTAIAELQKCLKSVQAWMAANKLKLNPDKTEFIVFGSEAQRKTLSTFFPIDILDNKLTPSDTVRNLGVKLDSSLNMAQHISDVIKSCYYHIKDLRRIRRHLTKSVAITLSNALVGSKIDYCNSLFHGITDKQMRRLQGVQNTLCRIVTRTSRYSSITGPMMSLHWLPIKFRIRFKINLLTYRVYNTHYPVYLESCIQPYKSPYPTRLSDPVRHTLDVPYFQYKKHNSFVQLKNSFAYTAPRLWNSLNETCRSAPSVGAFRARLKTYLWAQAYPP